MLVATALSATAVRAYACTFAEPLHVINLELISATVDGVEEPQSASASMSGAAGSFVFGVAGAESQDVYVKAGK